MMTMQCVPYIEYVYLEEEFTLPTLTCNCRPNPPSAIIALRTEDATYYRNRRAYAHRTDGWMEVYAFRCCAFLPQPSPPLDIHLFLSLSHTQLTADPSAIPKEEDLPIETTCSKGLDPDDREDFFFFASHYSKRPFSVARIK